MKNQSNDSHRTGDERFNTAGPTTDEATTGYVRAKDTSQSKGKSSSELSIKKDIL
ncbi:hypothetical protein ACIGHG_18755 [Bacillus sp. NPDC077411]|uniref:Catalase n=1 Tax=Bacillus bruguierae TaxID=3127667 RepID=A0ABU8FJT6_9BACI